MSTELLHGDLSWVLRRLPTAVFNMVKERPAQLIIAGGFIRACIANEKVSDVDLFSSSKDVAELCARRLSDDRDVRFIETDNAFTVLLPRMPIQFIHRWTYSRPEDVVPSFDFTIAQAAVWYDGNAWRSLISDRFYADLAARRLVYTLPVRNEEAGGSILRVLKFYQRGYRIPLDSLGNVIARLMRPVDMSKISGSDDDREAQLGKVLTGLLREVDPNVDPTHEAHMPAETRVEDKPEF